MPEVSTEVAPASTETQTEPASTLKASEGLREKDLVVEDDLLVEEDLLVEDVSIDGMCGVY
jgi:mycofactocin precursor